MVSESTGASTLMIHEIFTSLNPLLVSFMFVWALFSFTGKWLFPHRKKCEVLPLPLVNIMSIEEGFFFSSIGVEEGGRGGKNLKSRLIGLLWVG